MTYYVCHGKTQWKQLGKPKCLAPSLWADEIERVVCEDVLNFCKSPEVVLEQLRSQRKPVDESIAATIEHVSAQITELKRQEFNLIKISATSKEANPQTLDELLAENHKSQEELLVYKANLEMEQFRADTLEQDLVDVAERLAQLGDRIEQASFEERRRAIEQLVKEILVQPEVINGRIILIMTITYCFNDPIKEIARPPIRILILKNVQQ